MWQVTLRSFESLRSNCRDPLLPPVGTARYARGRGFTLIELLVVISIIALLISILLPALSAARAAALVVTCASQQRQIAMGLYQYADDYDDWYPRWLSHHANQHEAYEGQNYVLNSYIAGGSEGSRSVNATREELGGLQIVLCPNVDENLRPGYVNYGGAGMSLSLTYRVAAGHGHQEPMSEDGHWGNWFGWLPSSTHDGATPLPRRLHAGRNPVGGRPGPLSTSQQPILSDLWDPVRNQLRGASFYGAPGAFVRNNHEQGNNVTYADGHVKFSNAPFENEMRFGFAEMRW